MRMYIHAVRAITAVGGPAGRPLWLVPSDCVLVLQWARLEGIR